MKSYFLIDLRIQSLDEKERKVTHSVVGSKVHVDWWITSATSSKQNTTDLKFAKNSLLTGYMEDVLQKIAITGATFVGKAAWSYAASLALKKISASVQEREVTKPNSELQQELEVLDKRLSRKLQIVTPIIDKCEILVAQGHTGLDNVLLLTDELKQHLLDFSSQMYRNEPEENIAQLKELIMELDDLIPLLQLVMTTTNQSTIPTSDTIAYSRLIQASSALVTGDSIVSFSEKSNGFITVGPSFPVRMYTLFEGSARKNSVDWTWKEEFAKGIVTIERSTQSRHYVLNIQEDFQDGRYHDTTEVPKVRKISVHDISKMFYTCSGKLLNIQESLLPVLVLKVVEKEESTTETPAKARPEWLALELYKSTPEDDYETESEPEVGQELEQLQLHEVPSTPSKVSVEVTSTDTEGYSLSHLCLLEYMLRLCALEVRELKSHTQVSDELLVHSLANTKRVQYEVSQQNRKAIQSPAARAPRLMDRFLSG
jgi:hypothetical protein